MLRLAGPSLPYLGQVLALASPTWDNLLRTKFVLLLFVPLQVHTPACGDLPYSFCKYSEMIQVVCLTITETPLGFSCLLGEV